jgi:monoamine oxidase
VRILRAGWGFYGPADDPRRRIHRAPRTFAKAARLLRDEIRDYSLAGERWDSAVAVAIARRSVAQHFAATDVDRITAAGVKGLRGFFLADPEDLSLLMLVDQFASGDAPGGGRMFRLRGGNDRLPAAMAAALQGSLLLNTIVRRVARDASGVRITCEQKGVQRELRADICVITLPAVTLRDVQFDPELPADQQRAIATLRYGAATRLLLQFYRRFWKRARRPQAFGSDLPIGAVWDANEQQRGPAGILALLAGGGASAELQSILAAEGPNGVVERLGWLGTPGTLLASKAMSWEADEWARGGYAYFDPAFDPRLRAWLARPAGRVLFAGEHTSDRWQGYMNGAVESGHRAAAEARHLGLLTTD